MVLYLAMEQDRDGLSAEKSLSKDPHAGKAGKRWKARSWPSDKGGWNEMDQRAHAPKVCLIETMKEILAKSAARFAACLDLQSTCRHQRNHGCWKL